MKSSTNANTEDAKYGEFIPMEVDSDVEEIRESVRDVISTLSVREQQILDFRFGLSDGFPRTLEETGKMFGVTREHVRQIQEKALSMLRRRIHKPLQESANDAVDDDIERLLAGQAISAARIFS